MTSTDETVITYINDLLNPDLLQTASLVLQKNSGVYNSIQIKVENNPYRSGVSNEFLFARVRTTGKQPYISFNTRHFNSLKMFENNLCSISSEPTFFRIDLQSFLNYPNSKQLSDSLGKVFFDSFNFPTFGCCSQYEKCSREKHCIHPDLLYATACMYRKNLEAGKIFY